MIPASTIINRYAHLMDMYEEKIPMEEGWTFITLVSAMQELNWVLTGVVPRPRKR